MGGIICLGILAVQYVYYVKEQNKFDETIAKIVALKTDLRTRKAELNLARVVTIGLIAGILYLISYFWNGIWTATLWTGIMVGLFNVPLILAKLLRKH